MLLSVNNNPATIGTAKHLNNANNSLLKNFRRLSSGFRIASASDDAAGLAISEGLRGRIAALGQASRNAYDGVSVTQTAEGGLHEVSNIIGRLKELSVQAQNGTLSESDKETLQNEANDLISQIDQISESTEFNGVNLLNGSVSTMEMDVGGGGDQEVDTMSVSLDSISSQALGLLDLDISAGSDAALAASKLDEALNSVSGFRARLGSAENRLNSTISSLDDRVTGLVAAESRIRDVDVAKESARLIQNKIRHQAALSVHAQAGLQPQATLSLLQQ